MIEGYEESNKIIDTIHRKVLDKDGEEAHRIKFEMKAFKEVDSQDLSFYTFERGVDDHLCLLFAPKEHLQSILNFIKTLEGN